MATEDPKPKAGYEQSSYRWYALAILALIYACHSMDRQVAMVVLEPIRAEFDLSDQQLGLVSGLAYAVFFALAGIPMGILVDRLPRRKLLAAILVIWSSLTALCGLVQGYVALLLARMGVGAAESGSAPAALSMLMDIFATGKRATAIGIFYLSHPLGTFFSFVIGAYIAATFGWRAAFFAAGVPGLILAAVLLLTVREPRRGGAEAVATAKSDGSPSDVSLSAPTTTEVFRFFVRTPLVPYCILAGCCCSATMATIGTWGVSFFMRIHDSSLQEAGNYLGLANGIGGAIALPIIGPLSDWLARRDRRAPLWFMAAATTIAAAMGMAMLFVPTVALAAAFLFLFHVFAYGFTPPIYATMLSATPPRMRGTIMSLSQVLSNLVGVGLGPYLAGVLSDIYGGSDSIRLALASILFINLLAALFMILAARSIQKSNYEAGSAGVLDPSLLH